MNILIATDLELQDFFWQIRTRRKELQELEKEMLSEMNRRGNLPELPASYGYRNELLTPQKKIDLAKWLEHTSRTPGEIIQKIESLSKGK